ncbi:MAG: hypothetical protein PVI99_04530 [Anaerolineales bacterium]|jgi:hypothetical protein
MMRSQNKRVLLLAVSICLVMVFLFGLLGKTATVHAQEKSTREKMDLTLKIHAAPNIILVTFTDTSPIQYTDLSGNVIGEGMHVGELLCIGDNCNQKVKFEPISAGQNTEPVVFEYKFKSKQAFDPVTERVVVSGTGTLSNAGQKTRFSFTGVFENNGDGTVKVTYISSTPEASFIFPAAPGTFDVFSSN